MIQYLRVLLVFVVMAVLLAQTLTRFLDAWPLVARSRGIEGINAFLDFVLISRIGIAPSAAVLAVLTVVFTVMAYRRQFRETEPAAQAAPPERIARALQPAMP